MKDDSAKDSATAAAGKKDKASKEEKSATKSDSTKNEKSAKDAKSSKTSDSKASDSKSSASKTTGSKSAAAKRTSRSGNPAKRPQGRKTASYTSTSGQQTIKPNPSWFLPVLIGLLLIGLIWLVTFYITQGAFPVEAWGNWNILIGFAFFVAGLIMSTRWR
nr:cell division protein CrgA [Brevibacterium permense]